MTTFVMHASFPFKKNKKNSLYVVQEHLVNKIIFYFEGVSTALTQQRRQAAVDS